MDFMATKGIEYLLVIGYLLLLIPFSRLLLRREPLPAWAGVPAWFSLPEGFRFHRGHGWAQRLAGQRLRVGLDDFAVRMLGPAQGIELPSAGQELSQSREGWALLLGSERIPMLSPVSGRVVRLNPAVVADPQVASSDPYGEGWLFEVETPDAESSLRGLLSGRTARAWMREVEAGLLELMGSSLGPVLQDGGTPFPGFVRELEPEDWPVLAKRLLLVD